MLFACLLIFGIIMIIVAVIIAVIGAIPLLVVAGRIAIGAFLGYLVFKAIDKRKKNKD